jgi:hypothetical protein
MAVMLIPQMIVQSDKFGRSLRQEYGGRGNALMEEWPKYLQTEHGYLDRKLFFRKYLINLSVVGQNGEGK